MKKLFLAGLCLGASAALAQALPPKTPLVTSGSVVVTAHDFEAQMTRIPENLRSETRASLERVAQMTDNLFVNRMLAAQAKAAGFLDEPLIAQRGQQVLEAYQAKAWLDHLERTFKFPNLEARARELYLNDRQKFVVPETYEVEHILVNLWGRTKEMALERANEARAKVLAGADFVATAKEYVSDARAAQAAGKLGVVPASALDVEIAQVLPRLKNGEISQPIFTRAGYHVVRVVQRFPGRALTFDEVKEGIMDEERNRAVRRATDERIHAIRNDAKTRIDSEALKKLVVELPREEMERLQREAQRGAKPQPAPSELRQ